MAEPNYEISRRVIAACIEVHQQLGPGLLESIYESALCEELSLRNVPYQRQVTFPAIYRGRELNHLYRLDLLVQGELLVEVKSVEQLLPVHVAQVVTYLRLARLESGLLVNFNTTSLRLGLRRVFRTPKTSCAS